MTDIAQAPNPPRNVCFIWIPKTGGTSISSMLKLRKHSTLDEIRQFPQHGAVTFGHFSYEHLLAAGLISSTFHENSYKFCCVRNPYDRAVSLYAHLHLRKQPAKVSFAEFCERLRDKPIDPPGLYSNQNLSICSSQLCWMFCNAQVLPDDILRLEQLAESMHWCSVKLKKSFQMLHLNRSKRQPTLEYYDAYTKQIISDVYGEDIHCFGYKFPNSHSKNER